MAFNRALSNQLGGLRMELSLVDRSGKVQNFYSVYDDIVEEMQNAMLDCALLTQSIAFELCPVDTGFMRDHIEVITDDSMQVFEIGWRAEPFFAAGLQFYPMFVVLGTRFMPARDPLTPAYAQTKPEYEVRNAAAINRALERRRMAA
jgi:hypothetical protein